MSFPISSTEVPYVDTEQMVEVDRAMINDYGIELIQTSLFVIKVLRCMPLPAMVLLRNLGCLVSGAPTAAGPTPRIWGYSSVSRIH